MSELDFDVAVWLKPDNEDSVEEITLGSLRISVGADRVLVTQVEDTIARTVRDHINVPAFALAEWMLINWWRLRWEPRPKEPTFEWFQAHSMASVSGDYVWPALEFSSDGEFVQVKIEAEDEPDVSAIRYLRDIVVDIPAAHFESAVDRFTNLVESRVVSFLPHQQDLSDLTAELQDERGDPELARRCKLQALAGIDPGSASKDWFRKTEKLATKAGPLATEEIMAVVPDLCGGLRAAEQAVREMHKSPITVKFDFKKPPAFVAATGELPWQQGTRLAATLRHHLDIDTGPLDNAVLEQLLNVRLPLEQRSWVGGKVLSGGLKNGVTNGRTPVLVPSEKHESQRFYLARLIGSELVSQPEQHVLPVSRAGTALQKLERSFAQELLCPWVALEAFIDEMGTDDEAIMDAAEHFQVSQLLVQTTLVNNGRLSREILPGR